MKTLLIDGDMLAYRNSAALEQGLTVEWGDGVTSHVDDAWKGHARMDRFLARLAETLGADKTIVCMSSVHSFRRDLCHDYKSNRDDKQRPTLLPEFAAYLKSHHKAVTYDRLEADDVMGILATAPRAKGDQVIVTIDKDLRQIPCWYYNPYPPTGKPKAVQITTQQADDFFFYQMLVGDPIDGYKGCRGIGPKKALNLIKEVRAQKSANPLAEIWKAVVAVYIAKGMAHEDALMNARMARILRYEDYDPKTGVKLWTPPD